MSFFNPQPHHECPIFLYTWWLGYYLQKGRTYNIKIGDNWEKIDWTEKDDRVLVVEECDETSDRGHLNFVRIVYAEKHFMNYGEMVDKYALVGDFKLDDGRQWNTIEPEGTHMFLLENHDEFLNKQWERIKPTLEEKEVN